eukprot:snap_masked-scaffold_5-processed-gene-4.29-mRNA-1 protein AED:1.00 eAED:1.00 QI:0/0/0/0/1/1/2/0/73
MVVYDLYLLLHRKSYKQYVSENNLNYKVFTLVFKLRPFHGIFSCLDSNIGRYVLFFICIHCYFSYPDRKMLLP